MRGWVWGGGRRAGAVIGVAMFGEELPGQFGSFDVSLFTLFLVTAGEPWPEGLPRLREDGSANGVVMLFCAVYTITTYWLILQVGPAPSSVWFSLARRLALSVFSFR